MGVINYEIRSMMLRYGLNQSDLAKLLDTDQPTISRMLKYELSRSEKDRIKEAIRKGAE